MTMASQSSSAQAPARQVAVTVQDSEGRLIGGASISFLVSGAPAGSVDASEGKAWISLFDPSATLEVVATVNGVSQSLQVSGASAKADFVFPGLLGGRSVPTPEAKCWNGATGRPCVICPVGGGNVRICC